MARCLALDDDGFECRRFLNGYPKRSKMDVVCVEFYGCCIRGGHGEIMSLVVGVVFRGKNQFPSSKRQDKFQIVKYES